MFSAPRLLWGALALLLLTPAVAAAQTTFHVASEAQLRTALTTAAAGDTIAFDANVTLTTGDLAAVISSITIDGAGHTLSGNNQYRGLFVAAFSPRRRTRSAERHAARLDR